MSASLAAAFRGGSGRKAKWQGEVVHSMLQLPVTEGDTIRVTRLATSATRAQALKVGVDRGQLRANGVLMQTAAIWSHTSPDTTTLEITSKRSRSIDIWNSWSYEGVDSAWLGNSAMLIERDGDTHVLRCSDGLGDVSFDDLVVEVQVEHRGAS